MSCPICDSNSAKFELIGNNEVGTTRSYECDRCGSFAVAEREEQLNLRNEDTRPSFRPLHLSALLREQTLRKTLPHWLQFDERTCGPLGSNEFSPIHVQELLSRWPPTVAERIERLLCNLARLSPTAGHTILFNHTDTSLAFAKTNQEAYYHLKCLSDGQWLETTAPTRSSEVQVVLTPKGWERFESLRTQNAPENDVFVAMWFGTDMKRVYDVGIEPAVSRAGYRATRVDLEDFNDFIMDQVFSLIRVAPFVIADFTGNRNGVYLEAGFARGLGIPVINTCKEDHLDKAHFDVKQLNHIVWTSEEKLAEKLFYRITNTVGIGPRGPGRA